MDSEVIDFDTERSYDRLTMNGRYYSGRKKPSGLVPDSTIAWESDGDTTAKGDRLQCSKWHVRLENMSWTPFQRPQLSMLSMLSQIFTEPLRSRDVLSLAALLAGC